MNANIKLINLLISVIADTQVLLLTTQNYHWNVRGNSFKSLYNLFKKQYLELSTAVDKIDKIIENLANKIPTTWKSILN